MTSKRLLALPQGGSTLARAGWQVGKWAGGQDAPIGHVDSARMLYRLEAILHVKDACDGGPVRAQAPPRQPGAHVMQC